MKIWNISIHQLRSNNEDEYADHKIIELLEEYEIKWKSMTFYSWSQNEIAKQCFHTLFEWTHAILRIQRVRI